PEPPKIWTDIANDSKYPLERRREALFKLFERHVPPRTKLSALGELLAGAKWLENRDMTFEFAPSGLIPLNETNEATFGMEILPKREQRDVSWTIYLRTSIKVEPRDILKALRGEKISSAVAEVTVLEYSLCHKEPGGQYILMRGVQGSEGESTKRLQIH